MLGVTKTYYAGEIGDITLWRLEYILAVGLWWLWWVMGMERMFCVSGVCKVAHCCCTAWI